MKVIAAYDKITSEKVLKSSSIASANEGPHISWKFI